MVEVETLVLERESALSHVNLSLHNQMINESKSGQTVNSGQILVKNLVNIAKIFKQEGQNWKLDKN